MATRSIRGATPSSWPVGRGRIPVPSSGFARHGRSGGPRGHARRAHESLSSSLPASAAKPPAAVALYDFLMWSYSKIEATGFGEPSLYKTSAEVYILTVANAPEPLT